MTPAEKNWTERDLRTFDRMPRKVREVIRQHEMHIDMYELAKLARTERDLLAIIESGKAPRI